MLNIRHLLKPTYTLYYRHLFSSRTIRSIHFIRFSQDCFYFYSAGLNLLLFLGSFQWYIWDSRIMQTTMEAEYPFDEVRMEHLNNHADRSSSEVKYESPPLQSWSFDPLEEKNDIDRTSETKSAIEVRNIFTNLNVQRRQALFRSTKTQNCPNVVTPTLEEKKQALHKLRHFGGTSYPTGKLHNTTTTNIYGNQIKKLEPIMTIMNDQEEVEREDHQSPSDVRETIRIFGGAGKMRKLTAVQLRRLEIEQKTKEVEERNNADPKTDFKSSWKSPTNAQNQVHGRYKKTLRHVKGVRSKRTLEDLP